MNELVQILKVRAIRSYRYNTFRGKWRDMPDSTWLCVLLGIASNTPLAVATYVEYGWLMAWAVPFTWLPALWLFCDSWKPNKRLLPAFFLTSIPLSFLMMFAGSGHYFVEVVVGVYISASLLLLRTRGDE